MKLWLVVIVMAFFFVQCQDEIELIPEEKMIDIMIDMSVSEQILRKYDPVYRDSIQQVLMKTLLKIHDVTQEQLDTNLYIYQSDLNGFKDLTQKMVEKMQSIQEEITKEKFQQ